MWQEEGGCGKWQLLWGDRVNEAGKACYRVERVETWVNCQH